LDETEARTGLEKRKQVLPHYRMGPHDYPVQIILYPARSGRTSGPSFQKGVLPASEGSEALRRDGLNNWFVLDSRNTALFNLVLFSPFILYARIA